MLRLAAVGTSSTGKSALLNALFGTAFAVDPRAGSTTRQAAASVTFEGTELEVIDTPPLETHGALVKADLFLLVCDKDLIEAEYEIALRLSRTGRPLVVALNKSDTYDRRQHSVLREHLRQRLAGVVPPGRIVASAADPVRLIDEFRPDGSTVERVTSAEPHLDEIVRALHDAIEEAKASLRVQAREYTREAIERARSAASAGWKRFRNG
jgi:small GTP-binding protein